MRSVEIGFGMRKRMRDNGMFAFSCCAASNMCKMGSGEWQMEEFAAGEMSV
jgi:hypothetical protein